MSDPSQAKSIFLSASELPAAEREAYLDNATAGDSALRLRVEALLRAHDTPDSFLEQPAAQFGATVDLSPVELPIAEQLGSWIGPYKLLEQIGEGGMGVVYLAEQQAPVRRRVALKVVKTGMDTRQVIARFEAERQALALMDHSNIARVLDAGATESGRPYFVMELVRGVPITEYCDQNTLAVKERLELFVQVCYAVQHAHQKGIIHRDLKPSNVMVTVNDGRSVPKVIDFGIAKATGQQLTEKTLFTAFAQMVGTPLYMSPEQAEMTSVDIDTRSDIYSLGVLLYELLTGTTPFDQQRLRQAAFDEVRRIIREEEPPRPSTRISTLGEKRTATAAHRKADPNRLRRLVAGDLDWIVMKSLDKDRARRYDTAGDFAADVLRHLNEQPVEACPPSAFYRFRKFVRRNTTALAIAALVLFFLLLLGGGVGWAVRDRSIRQAALKQGVNSALCEVEDWHQRENWPEAMAAVKRAEGVLAAGVRSPELSSRVGQWRANLETIARLEEVALSNSEGDQFDFSTVGHAQYEREFRAMGIDIDGQPIEEAAARIRALPIRDQLTQALDNWAQYRRNIMFASIPRRWDRPNDWWRRPLAVARAADPDETRVRVRLAVERGDAAALVSLAKSTVKHPLPGSTLRFLAREVYWAAGDQDLAIQILKNAQRDQPNDFWINKALANYLKHPNTRHPQFVEAVNYCTAAVALRPQNAWAQLGLAESLNNAGRPDESQAVALKTLGLKPEFAEAYNALGNALQAQRKLGEAEAAYREAIELKPSRFEFYGNLGTVLARQGHFDEAIAAHRKSIEIEPKNVLSHASLGIALQAHGKLDEAVSEFHKAIELRPDSAMAYIQLGHALELRGKHDEAAAACHKAFELHPDSLEDSYSLGIAHQILGQLEEAVAAYRLAIRLRPRDFKGYSGLGSALVRQEHFDEAIPVLRKAIELEPGEAPAHLNLGSSLENKERFDEAVAAFRKAIELKPNYAEAYDCLGLALRDSGKLDEAVAAHRKAIELQPNANAYSNLGTALQSQGKLDESVAAHRKAIELQPDHANAHHNLGCVLRDQGKLDEAAVAFRRAIELLPAVAEGYAALGQALYEQGKLDEAVAAFRKAIELKPDHFEFYYNLGVVLQDQKKLSEAITAYWKAIELEPSDYEAYKNLASILASADAPHRDPARALELATRATELGPTVAAVWNALGVARYRVGQWQPAIAAIEKSMKLSDGGDANDWFVLAMAQWQLGRKEDARKWYDKAVAWMDKNQPTGDELRRFRAEADGLWVEKPADSAKKIKPD